MTDRKLTSAAQKTICRFQDFNNGHTYFNEILRFYLTKNYKQSIIAADSTVVVLVAWDSELEVEILRIQRMRNEKG